MTELEPESDMEEREEKSPVLEVDETGWDRVKALFNIRSA